jgi:methyl coenzyme M reductase alpha subunit
MTSPLQQKLKIAGPVVVTANRLADGAVIYRAAGEQWTTDLATAAVVTTSEAAKALLAGAAADLVRIVDPYVAPVELADGRPRPGNLRERIRAAGPTFPLPRQPEANGFAARDLHVYA